MSSGGGRSSASASASAEGPAAAAAAALRHPQPPKPHKPSAAGGPAPISYKQKVQQQHPNSAGAGAGASVGGGGRAPPGSSANAAAATAHVTAPPSPAVVPSAAASAAAAAAASASAAATAAAAAAAGSVPARTHSAPPNLTEQERAARLHGYPIYMPEKALPPHLPPLPPHLSVPAVGPFFAFPPGPPQVPGAKGPPLGPYGPLPPAFLPGPYGLPGYGPAPPHTAAFLKPSGPGGPAAPLLPGPVLPAQAPPFSRAAGPPSGPIPVAAPPTAAANKSRGSSRIAIIDPVTKQEIVPSAGAKPPAAAPATAVATSTAASVARGSAAVSIIPPVDKERLEKERQEKERQEKQRAEKERQEKEQAEKARLEAERLEKERAEKERLEKERQEQERLEKERLEQERQEKERLERERQEKERQEKEEKDRLENERLEKERLEKERLEKERLEKESQDKEREEKEERERRERERLAAATEPVEEEDEEVEEGADEDDEDAWDRRPEDELVQEVARRPDVAAGGPASLVYPAGGWAPHNRSGKKMYDRSFLLRFQSICTERPDGMPPLAELLGDEAAVHEVPARATFSPAAGGGGAWRGPPGMRPPPPGSQGRSRAAPPGFGAPRPPGIGRAGSKELPRQRSAIKPKSGKPLPVIAHVTPLQPSKNRWVRPSTVVAPTDEVTLRKIKGLLNKLSPDNFDSITAQLAGVGITTLPLLVGLIRLVFDKALLEPNWAAMYADLCVRLAEVCPGEFPAPADAPPGSPPQTFKRILLNKCQEEFESAGKPAPPEGIAVPPPTEDEEAEACRRKRMLGNIKFIGELFKKHMLTERIMHQCIQRLLGQVKNPMPEDIEALCKLLTTIGETIDIAKAEQYMTKYFSRMEELANNKKLPSRIRFMLRDVIDLRANKWRTRKPTAVPTHTAAPGTRDREQPLQRSSGPGSDRRGPTALLTRTGVRPTTAPERFDAPRSRDMAAETLVLTPGGGFGARPAPARPTPAPATPAPVAARSRSDSVEKPPATPAAASKTPVLSKEALETEQDGIFEEFLVNSEVKEAVELLAAQREHQPAFSGADLVFKLGALYVEKTDAHRESLGALLQALQEQHICTAAELNEGVLQLVAALPDLALDAPRAPAYVAQLVAEVMVTDALPATFLLRLPLPEELVMPGLAATLLGETLQALVALDVPERTLVERFGGLDIARYLPPRSRSPVDVDAWLRKYELVRAFPLAAATHLLAGQVSSRSLDTAGLLRWMEEKVQWPAAQAHVEACGVFAEKVVRAALEQTGGAEADAVRVATPVLQRLQQGAAGRLSARLVQALIGAAGTDSARASGLCRAALDGDVLSKEALLDWARSVADQPPDADAQQLRRTLVGAAWWPRS